MSTLKSADIQMDDLLELAVQEGASDLQTGAKWGMQTLDAHLLELWREGKIAYEELVTKAQDTEEVMQQIRAKQ